MFRRSYSNRHGQCQMVYVLSVYSCTDNEHYQGYSRSSAVRICWMFPLKMMGYNHGTLQVHYLCAGEYCRFLLCFIHDTLQFLACIG